MQIYMVDRSSIRAAVFAHILPGCFIAPPNRSDPPFADHHPPRHPARPSDHSCIELSGCFMLVLSDGGADEQPHFWVAHNHIPSTLAAAVGFWGGGGGGIGDGDDI